MTTPVVEIYQALENEILMQIVRRLKTSGEVDITQWHVEKLDQLRLLNTDVAEYLAEATGLAKVEIQQAIESNGYQVVKDTDKYMEMSGKKVPAEMVIHPVMEAYINQTFRELDNYVNQTLITTNFGTGTATRVYQNIIEETTAKFSSGLMTFDQAIEDTILQWVDKGIPSTFIDKGGHTWSIDRYVDTVLRSTNSRVYNELRTSRMSEYGVYTVLVSSKPNSREACSHIQGMVVDIREPHLADGEYPNIYDYGYGTPAGHRGISCQHLWYPFIPGVNTNNQPQYDAQEAQLAEEVEQGRRTIARRIRKTKQKVMITGELDSDSHERYKRLLRRQQADMRAYVADNNLTRNYRHEKVYTPVETLIQ